MVLEDGEILAATPETNKLLVSSFRFNLTVPIHGSVDEEIRRQTRALQTGNQQNEKS